MGSKNKLHEQLGVGGRVGTGSFLPAPQSSPMGVSRHPVGSTGV